MAEWRGNQLHETMFKEFKEFALKGNLIDMAVAFVMGAAHIGPAQQN